jgi:ATP-dependent DNA helicase RecQ
MCLGEADVVPGALELAQKILSCVLRLGEMAGPSYTALVLFGSREQRVLGKGHDKLSTWGILSGHPVNRIRDWIEHLVGQGYLEKTGEFNILQVTPSGRSVLQGLDTPRLLQTADTGRPARRKSAGERESWEGVDQALFERLRILRKSIADERSVPAFVIFSDASLRDMARKRPTSLGGFLLVHGVGRKKCDDLGDAFVAEIRQHCDANGLPADVSKSPASVPPAAAPRAKAPNKTARDAFQLFEMGRSVAEVAEGLGRAESTTYQYLEDYVRDRELSDPHP